ncbi:MAG: transposase family protein [Actinomycetota bacterium]|nr:transposase family protein [Actinomycetota bacterium]
MSSSPFEAAAAAFDAPTTPAVTLVAALRTVPDPRDRRGVRHALPVFLAVTLAAVLAGARSFTAIGEWVIDQDHTLMLQLGASEARRPSESTTRRVLSRSTGTSWTNRSGRTCGPGP